MGPTYRGLAGVLRQNFLSYAVQLCERRIIRDGIHQQIALWEAAHCQHRKKTTTCTAVSDAYIAGGELFLLQVSVCFLHTSRNPKDGRNQDLRRKPQGKRGKTWPAVSSIVM
jgi:hypothetical protein